MRLTTTLTSILYLTTLVASTPFSPPLDNSLAVRDTSSIDSYSALEKRKGGGGRGGGSSSSGGGSSAGGRPAASQGNSNAGGRTSSGSGTPTYSGNRYIGGASVPYTAGGRSPSRSILPYTLPVAGLAIFPGLWLYGSLYAYPWGYPYHWYADGRNNTSNVTCLCQEYSVCGCDPDDDADFLQQMVGNGTDAPVNTTTVRTIQYPNGTYATYINGTLDNGTTAAGGVDDDEESLASISRSMGLLGYWLMAATVVVGIMS